MLENEFRNAIVQNTLAIEHGVFLGVEGGGVILEMLDKGARLWTLIKDLRLAFVNATAAVHHV
jgi:hypothetical protein